MASWGPGALESDDAIDWMLDFEEKTKIVPKLKRYLKSKESLYIRCAAEWSIRAHKAGLILDEAMWALAPLAISRLELVKEMDSDPRVWTTEKGRISDSELKEISIHIKRHKKDVDKQIRYMKKFI